MLKQMFCVLDLKSGIYASPFTSVNPQTALRDFQRASSDPNTDLANFPEDYCLMHIATYDDVTGNISPLEKMENLGNPLQFLKKE